MKTVRQACELKPNALDIQLADQIENIDAIIKSEADGRAFFDRTHVTANMRLLFELGMARLAGRSSVAVYHLKQAMGGGKTHLMIAFGFLARFPGLRREVIPDIPHVNEFDGAAVAAFNGRNFPNEFFWGSIADQLGAPAVFRRFWAEGPKAPGRDDWHALFREIGNRPVLILLDEMPPYFQNYATQPSGAGTIADILTTALATLLVAASERPNVCVVISDLEAAYDTGGHLINQALRNAINEVERGAKDITPLDLSSDDIYQILRKRLFARLPGEDEIRAIAEAFRQRYEEAVRARSLPTGADQLADEIPATYPFHPRYKNIIALFKENLEFRQTRGVIELTSRLLKSVWGRPNDDVYLIGPQHFDFSIPDVRDKLAQYSGMADVIARDVWDAQGSAHAQEIDREAGGDAAAQVAALLFTASMSNVPNAVRGLTAPELIHYLLAPNREATVFRDAFDRLRNVAWYLHRSEEERYYFDRQENLVKMLQTLATNAPDPRVDELIQERLRERFQPKTKHAYEDLLLFPEIAEAAETLRRCRALLVLEPADPFPSAALRDFFQQFPQKNNLLVLSGQKSRLADLRTAARMLYAAQRALDRVPKGHPQREELENRLRQCEKDLDTTILSLFDTVVFPVQRPNQPAELHARALNNAYDQTRPYDGETQIIKTLEEKPTKLYLNVEENYNLLKEKIETLLWPENLDAVRWGDIATRAMEHPGMCWVPRGGLDQVLRIACNRGEWEDLGNGQITNRPRPKHTDVMVTAEPELGDEGYVRLRVEAVNGGTRPRIHYAEDARVSESSPVLTEPFLRTRAMRVEFLVVDPEGRFPTGEPRAWTNTPTIRHELFTEEGQRKVRIQVAPCPYGTVVRYTLDGRDPRDGTSYETPFPIGNGDYVLRVFANPGGVEATDLFTIPPYTDDIVVDPTKPAAISNANIPYKIDDRSNVFQALAMARERRIVFEEVSVEIGRGEQHVSLHATKVPFPLDTLEKTLEALTGLLPPDTPVVFKFRDARFPLGQDLLDFGKRFDLKWKQEDIRQ